MPQTPRIPYNSPDERRARASSPAPLQEGSPRGRDIALLRLSKANRWLIAASAGLTGVLTAVAASAFPGRKLAAGALHHSAGVNVGRAASSQSSTGESSSAAPLKGPSEEPSSEGSSNESPSAGSSSAETSPGSSTGSGEATSTEGGSGEGSPSAGSTPSESAAGTEATGTEATAPTSEAPVVSGGS